VLKVY